MFGQPELPGAALAASVHEPDPVEVIDMAPRAGPHEPCRNDGTAVEAVLVVERLAMRQAPRAASAVAGVGLLHDEPLREGPGPDAVLWRPWLGRLRWRGVHAGGLDPGDGLQKARQSRVDDLIEVVGAGPGLEPGDDRGVVGQVDERAGAVGGDHLALAQLSVPSAHELSDFRDAVSGWM